MRCVASKSTSFLKLKVGEVNVTSTIRDERTDSNADSPLHILTSLYAFAETDEVVDTHGGHLLKMGRKKDHRSDLQKSHMFFDEQNTIMQTAIQ